MRHTPAINLALIAHLFESKTRKELADYLGVSTRSIRRWFNEGKPPSKSHQKTINKKAGQIRATATREIKKAAQPPLPKNLPFPPFIEKRLRKDGGTDIYYDVSMNSHDEILKILVGLSSRRNAVFINYRIFCYKKRYGEYGTRGPIAINQFDPEEIDDLLLDIETFTSDMSDTGEINHILEIRVTDYLVR